MTVQNLPNGQTNAQTAYGYDSISKRLQTITVNGVTFTIAYVSGSTSQIGSITTSVAGQAGNALTTTYAPYGLNASEVGQIKAVNSGGTTLYNANFISYNQNNQIGSQDVTSVDPSGNPQTNNYVYTYGSGTGDNSEDAHSLTKVTDNGTVTETYSYDGVGNFEGTNLGDANTLNQYAALSYNLRGDVLDDGTYAYTYDANDRMIGVTPHDTTQSRLTYGYDSQGRRIWKNVYSWNASGGGWVMNTAACRTYVYDGTQLVGELDSPGKLLTGYTWSPSGQLLAVTDYTQATARTYVAIIDASGNTAMLVDPTNGTVAASYTYDSYGNLLSATGPAQAICSILGKGLYYDIEARSIGHALDRDVRNNIWYERDPAGEIAGGANLYQYLGGDPIDLSDTSGLAAAPAQAPSGIGYTYTITGIDPQTGQPVTYVGSAADILARMGTHKGALKILIRAAPTRIVASKVSGSPDSAASGRQSARSALNEALRSQEQVKLQQNGGTDAPGSLNQRNAATPENMTKWQSVHGTSASDDVVLKEAGKPLPDDVPPELTLSAWFPLLQVAEITFVQIRDSNAGEPLSTPFVYQDHAGDFTVSESYSYALAGLIKWNHAYSKTYINGPRAGKTQAISSGSFDAYKQEGVKRWGYINIWGNFVPGSERSTISIFDSYGNKVGYEDKDGKHLYPRGSPWLTNRAGMI